MIRRAFIAGTGLALCAPFSGCLTDSEPATARNDTERTDDTDTTVRNDSNCFEVLSVILVDVRDRVKWGEADIPIVDSGDERLSDISVLQDLLANAVDSEGTVEYEYRGEWFEAAKKSDKRRRIPESDELVDTISELPSGDLPGVPSGPYIRHGEYYFAVIVETEEPCPE